MIKVGTKIEVVESFNCDNCVFYRSNICEDMNCVNSGVSIIFKEIIEKDKYELGKTYEINGVKVKIELGDSCVNCAFNGSQCPEVSCTPSLRYDKNDIIFKALTDKYEIGKTYEIEDKKFIVEIDEFMSCTGCVFYEDRKCIVSDTNCVDRLDGKTVIFKEVNDNVLKFRYKVIEENIFIAQILHQDKEWYNAKGFLGSSLHPEISEHNFYIRGVHSRIQDSIFASYIEDIGEYINKIFKSLGEQSDNVEVNTVDGWVVVKAYFKEEIK